jgi:hypothetical protein
MTIDEAIKIAKENVTNGYALTYLNAMPIAIEMYGTEGLQSQLEYALENMGSWKGPLAREVKATMKTWIKLAKKAIRT